MSKETYKWLAENVKIGFVDEYGPAWWKSMADALKLPGQSHFYGPVPDEAVRKLLDVPLVTGEHLTRYVAPDGKKRTVVAGNRKDIVRADTGAVLGVFRQGYQIHGYDEWTRKTLDDIADTPLKTRSVGLLRGGAVAWHQAVLPDSYEVGSGNGKFTFQPFILGATSADGSLASSHSTGAFSAVCDNTLSAALDAAASIIKTKHSKNSARKLGEIRDKLGLVLKAGDDFVQQAEDLMDVDVSEKDFALWLDEFTPVPEVVKTKGGGPGRGVTMAETKREELTRLWTSDEKVAPWRGTAFGIMQMANTWTTWNRGVKGADGGRIERNFDLLVSGTISEEDERALKALKSVQDRKLVIA